MWPGSEWLNVKAESHFVRLLNNKIQILALKTEWQWESPPSLSSPVVSKHWDASESRSASETHIAGPSHAVWESAFLTNFQVATYVVREARSQKLASSTDTQILAFIGPQTQELGTYGFKGGRNNEDEEKDISVSNHWPCNGDAFLPCTPSSNMFPTNINLTSTHQCHYCECFYTL